MSEPAWVPQEDRPLRTIFRNVATRYVSVAAELAIGLLTLPFNLHHFGTEAYGLWMLTAGVTAHFSILDLGYGGAMVKFIAQYRAHRNSRALNEIASTLFYLFAGFGAVAYLVVVGLAFNLEHMFKLTEAQAEIGKWILLIIGVNVAINFPFSIYGGVSSGFQRFDINNLVSIANSLAVAAVNVTVVLMGYGLVGLVAATSLVRFVTYFIYRYNAYKVFPGLRIRPSSFRKDRLREVTGFSVYSSIIDWANKLNYELDEIVIGIFLGPAPVAVWAVAERIISGTQRLTNQGNAVLFPVVVDSEATHRMGRLQKIMMEGTRLSLATVLPLALVLVVLAEPLVRVWIRKPEVMGAVPVIQILAFAVALRVGNATSTTLLKGVGHIRNVALVNIATGIVNLILSAILIGPFGLPGVAIGTLIPIAFASIFILFPMACRRVELGIGYAFRRAVWPSIWPALVVGCVLFLSSQVTPDKPWFIVAEAAAAGLLYLVLFVVAVGRHDREQYTAKLWELAGRKRDLAPAT
jgi:O-antigen/teichoic acid export membrane protein